jgi:hypothetical protein
LRDPLLDLGEPGRKVLQATLLLEPLRLRCVPEHPAVPLADRHRQALLDAADGAAQPNPDVQEVGRGPLPLVVRGAGDRSCPAGRRRRRKGTLALGALVVAAAEPAACGKVSARKRSQVLSHRPEHHLVHRTGPQSRTDPGATGWGDHERRGEPPHQHTPVDTFSNMSSRILTQTSATSTSASAINRHSAR